MHRRGGGDVVADDAGLQWPLVGRDFHAGNHLDQLFLAAGGVEGGHLHDVDVVGFVFFQRVDQHGMGQALVVLHGDDAVFGLQGVFHDQQALDDLVGMLLHEHGVTGDVGFAFGAVEQQGADVVAGTGIELDETGKAGSAETDDAGIAQQTPQLGRLHVAIVTGLRVDGLILAVAFEHDAGRGHSGRMGHGPVFDGDHRTGGWRMDGGADELPGVGNHLSLAHPFADLHLRLAGFADVLLQGQDELFRDRGFMDELMHGHLLVPIQMQAAVEMPEPVFHVSSASGCSGSGSDSGCGHFQ